MADYIFSIESMQDFDTNKLLVRTMKTYKSRGRREFPLGERFSRRRILLRVRFSSDAPVIPLAK